MDNVVVYQGQSYVVPDWANYIAADGNGAVWCYEDRPVWVTGELVYSTGGRAMVLRMAMPIQPELVKITKG